MWGERRRQRSARGKERFTGSAVARRRNDAKKTAHLVRKTSKKNSWLGFYLDNDCVEMRMAANGKSLNSFLLTFPAALKSKHLSSLFLPKICQLPKDKASPPMIFMFFKVVVVFRQKESKRKNKKKKPLMHLDETRAKFCPDKVNCAVMHSDGTFCGLLQNLNVGNLPIRKSKLKYKFLQRKTFDHSDSSQRRRRKKCIKWK